MEGHCCPALSWRTSDFSTRELRRTPIRRSSRCREIPHRAGPMGQDFSGSCAVTSRNPLIHNGATNGTKSGRFDPKGEQQALLSKARGCVEEPFATVNFREFLFPRTWVNSG
jgi:hypothetical protein